MSASIHDKLNRVRKPRVHITYEVETEGAQIVRELPFVVGVMGDFSGDPTSPLRPMADRKFVQIDRDNFNDIMKTIGPRVDLTKVPKSTPAAVCSAASCSRSWKTVPPTPRPSTRRPPSS